MCAVCVCSVFSRKKYKWTDIYFLRTFMLLQGIVPAPLVPHNQNINLYDVESWRLLNGLVFEIPWRAAQKLDSPVAGLGSVKQMAVALGDFVGYDKHGLSVVGLRNGSLSWAYKVLTFLRAHLKRLGRDPWQKGRNKKNNGFARTRTGDLQCVRLTW